MPFDDLQWVTYRCPECATVVAARPLGPTFAPEIECRQCDRAMQPTDTSPNAESDTPDHE